MMGSRRVLGLREALSFVSWHEYVFCIILGFVCSGGWKMASMGYGQYTNTLG